MSDDQEGIEEQKLPANAIQAKKQALPPPPKQYDDVDPYTADHRDYVLTQSRMNLMAISQMSDLKANLILTLSAVMLQFALVKVSNHEFVGHKEPFWVIAIGSLITILFSAYSTLPKAPLRFTEKPDTGSNTVPRNLLFFTNFIPLTIDEYKRHMATVLRSPPHTHEAILEELHAHGRFISRRKYLPLRLAYFTFLLTWLVSATMYLLA